MIAETSSIAGPGPLADGIRRVFAVRDGVYYITLRWPGHQDALEIALPGVMTDRDADKVWQLFYCG